ncbi:sulfite exporter TauE/SafE family protein [Yimella sp. cx-51]|uniref:sulfite exporter TauE/SafE family protein n=1 Tax=Yimella sp. cx-51 TaxID=2770551 RepID=UPI00165DB490|nr:sulfite exporter TauE/SafE family protein [Yimella sp. cx-51]MBC9957389.1 sulfite exporter TauE/SafE family protein [Yimella sp. cx-51]QTH39371.1 sulfite exporter TauE/SafE family protein [Yimella sp. cx-51]
MPWTEALLILLAGMAAGTINTIVGSGTLVTFPTLLAFGVPSVTANVSNTVGLVAGGLSGTWGYRREVRTCATELKRLAPMSFLGAVVGALLLIKLPPEAFSAIVPALILAGVLLVIFGPRLQRWAAKNQADSDSAGRRGLLAAGVFVAGIYGGYFGAAQGVLLMGLMSVLLAQPLQRLNGVKNVLGTIVNSVAALTFIIVSTQHVNWTIAGLIAVGSLIGGFIGAHFGRKLPPNVLRGFIVVIGVVAIVNLLVK